ncbi:Com family DNA-binding transcriptional regulator [Allofranklinella schreckenbergeri]|uniref:Com family DNA-binding transcriptional regulator n=1 Tax=Allofranklinella schreckenbergeri TaxID=1076744 RepID=A0A3M6PZE3_9BURK|nr:Com family DNA-binding transcriptional regulator [Allofranklinella schreckenbergeri]RMW96046.1 Com family DNA-binding transcriptional regulator [Allofranklinella schreckenbergeri]
MQKDHTHQYTNQDIRCGQCGKKLGQGSYICLAIKCQRCKTVNHLRAQSPQPAPPDGLLQKVEDGCKQSSNNQF